MTDPMLVGSMRRWPRGEVRHIPGGGVGMGGTSTEGFLREYDEALTAAHREGAADALNSAAADWPDQGIVSLWLRKRAESLRGGA